MTAVRDTLGLSGFTARARDAIGLATVGSIKLRDALGLSTVWTNGPAITVAIAPFASGAASSSNTVSVSSEDIAAIVTGGRAPFTYAWSRVGGVDPDWSILFTSSATTRVMHDSVATNDTVTSSFICTVTDSAGQIATSNQCAVNLDNFGGFA
jgi:hypothetical protein